MKMYEIKWKPRNTGIRLQTEYIKADSSEGAEKEVERLAKALNVEIDWYGTRELKRD